MASSINDFGSVSNGLDRAQIDVGPRNDDTTDPRPAPEAMDYQKPSIRQAVKDNLLSAVVHPRYGISKIKAAIDEKHEASNSQTYEHHHDHAPTLAPPPPDSSVENQRLDNTFKDKPKFPPIKEFIHQPVQSVISTVQDQRGNDFAESIGKAEIAHGVDVQLLQQADKVQDASNETQEEAEYETFIQMKQLRQDFFVRWTIDRHLLKYQWETNAQNYIDPEFKMPMPDRKLLASSVERLIVDSTPLQTYVMKLRNISHWEDPRESFGYMILYFFLLFYSYITRALILYVLLKVLYRRWHPPTLRQMRKATAHSEDQDSIAQNLGELITQYGTRGWVDRVIEQAGPAVFDWLERLADILEMTQNFYEWRNPRYTAVTLSFLFTGLVIITLTPTWLLVQMSFLGCGVMFFILTPIGVRYPRYRLLASPITWLLWKSPTHAEWAVSRLQSEAHQYLTSDKTLSTIDKNTHLIGTYTCKDHNDVQGKLVVMMTSVSFAPKRSGNRLNLTQSSRSANKDKDTHGWSLLFDDIKEIHKITEQNSHGGEEAGLQFVLYEGEKRTVMHLARRDEVFSQIVGFSELEWKRCG
ncbi:hypothetical protein A1O7_02148 [Cladophialophora yegresii CBS 114405]|uniref:Uncharacterized protein n=1 Tax=Cladophialophora yegresii CBS 114405 TaxID=1182544 RepID=W9WTR2_9EURO|nr:uncharacterized protein A1O7_02148 [Cladophialophora yegresii CBS 114405]EXJ61719.1 hypothetical protein A1O7_02148 [Cladophialophora yegresii CBS 114405]